MATHKSALKRHRQSARKNVTNTAHRTRIRNLMRNVLTAVEEQNKDAAATSLLVVVPALQKAAVKGVMPRNTASRNISRLTLKVNALAAAAPFEAPVKKAPKTKKATKGTKVSKASRVAKEK